MSGRLIILSNRIPTEAEPSGGLVVALHSCLMETGGLWIGNAPDTVDVASTTLTELAGDAPYQKATFDVTEAEYEGFYLGYANSVLWPLFHRRSDLIEVDGKHAQAYATVNRRIAKMIAQHLEPDDLIWVHDYHFLPMAHELRRLGVRNRIGFFLHTPFPTAADLPALPQIDKFLDWLAAFDLVGLQTQRDVSSLIEAFRADPASELLLDGTLRRGDAVFRALSFPIGIDAQEVLDLACANNDVSLALPADEKLLIGVDRLDYSKGLVKRFDAFGAWLDARAPDDPSATFVQIAPPSRGALDAYQDIRAELESTSGRINGTHGKLDRTPIRYLHRNVPRAQVMGLLRRADVALVTPLADGMNLVAKEFVAAQDPDDPGVLILSHFAGASEQMTQALCVNPYDTEDMARTIGAALSMPLAERQERHAALLAGVRDQDITWWTQRFLDHLGGAGGDRGRDRGRDWVQDRAS